MAEKELGLPISDEAILQMKNNLVSVYLRGRMYADDVSISVATGCRTI